VDVEVRVEPGICGMPAVIRMHTDDGKKVEIEVRSTCESVNRFAAEIGEVDVFAELYSKGGEPVVLKAAQTHCGHRACPVPVAVLKGLEVAAGLALPCDATIHIEKGVSGRAV